MAGHLALIHQSAFRVSSQSMHQPLAPPTSTRVETLAELQADEILRRHSAVLEKQRKKRRRFLCILVLRSPHGKHQLSVTYLSERGSREENPQSCLLCGNPILPGTLRAEKIINISNLARSFCTDISVFDIFFIYRYFFDSNKNKSKKR